jgi:ATP/maltotriose-dependent transcriptional regulator MalT
MLTTTETKILNALYWQCLDGGGINRAKLAKKFKITYHTLQSHLKSIYFKLEVKDITSAIVKARDVFEVL